MDRTEITLLIKDLAAQQGFERVGIAPAQPLPRADYVRRWLESGMGGEMSYLARYGEKRLDASKLLEGAKSVIVCALNYHQTPPPPPDDQPYGRVAMYAWGQDYHVVLKKKLRQIIDQLNGQVPQPFRAMLCVDTVPLIEREYAMLAGVGWIGKNTMTLHQSLGSYFFLGEIVTTLELDYDAPATDHCGSCTKCLDACPTDAFPEAYQMDARRCISYHTIELRSEIPSEFHEPMQDWIFGCDICQQVCPFNNAAPQTSQPDFDIRSLGPYPSLLALCEWQQAEYDRHLQDSAIRRATLDMLQRNARIALANVGPAKKKRAVQQEPPSV